MDTNETEVIAQENDTETTETTAEVELAEETVVEETTETPAEDVEELKKKLATLEAQKEHWRKKASEPKKEDPQEGLSSKDILFLAKTDIHADDVDEVLDWAKFKKIPVSEAYSQLKDTLEVRAEKRTTAQAANVTNTRRPASKVSEDALLANAKSGKLPESDDDIARLVEAQMKAQRG